MISQTSKMWYYRHVIHMNFCIIAGFFYGVNEIFCSSAMFCSIDW